MFRSLTQRLIIFFLLVSVTTALLAMLFSRFMTVRNFTTLVLSQERDAFVTGVTNYYLENGSWDDVRREQLRIEGRPGKNGNRPPPDGRNGPGRDEPPPINAPEPLFILTDSNNRILLGAENHRIGSLADPALAAGGTPIIVDETVVGHAVQVGNVPELTANEAEFDAATTKALLWAGLGGVLAAIILGYLLARSMVKPIRQLTVATRSMASGDLAQEVPITSQDEIGELASSFNQMSHELTQAKEARRQMTADIAHELRSPLTVVAGYLESLREGVLAPTPKRLDVMYDEIQHLQHLVEDLRTLSLADAGRLNLNLQETPPRALLERAVAAYSQRAAEKALNLEVVADDRLPRVNVDPERIAQVLGNLVSNALRYTDSGGYIRLSATTDAESRVQLLIQDNGRGIDPQHVTRIFDRFYRADDSRTQEGSESGLGLAIAKSIIELHNGTIGVTSILDKGTTFRITLNPI